MRLPKLTGRVEGDDMVADLDIVDTLTDRLDNTSSLMSENHGESTLRVGAGQRVGIAKAQQSTSSCVLLADLRVADTGAAPGLAAGPAQRAGVDVLKDLDSDLSLFRRSHLDILDAQRLV